MQNQLYKPNILYSQTIQEKILGLEKASGFFNIYKLTSDPPVSEN